MQSPWLPLNAVGTTTGCITRSSYPTAILKLKASEADRSGDEFACLFGHKLDSSSQEKEPLSLPASLNTLRLFFFPLILILGRP